MEQENNKAVRTSVGIRDMLFDELDALRNGTSTPQRAHAIAKTAATILGSVKVELEYAKFLSDTGKTTALPPLQLGK